MLYLISPSEMDTLLVPIYLILNQVEKHILTLYLVDFSSF